MSLLGCRLATGRIGVGKTKRQQAVDIDRTTHVSIAHQTHDVASKANGVTQ